MMYEERSDNVVLDFYILYHMYLKMVTFISRFVLKPERREKRNSHDSS